MEVVHLFKAGIISEKELATEVSRNELTMRTRAFEEFAGSFSKVNKKVVKFIALSPEIQYAEYMWYTGFKQDIHWRKHFHLQCLKIKKNLDLITKLTKYIEDVEKILKMGISVMDLTKDIVLESKKIRLEKGLMTNDSLIYTAMIQNKIYNLATFDNDFNYLDTITVYKPTDI